MKRVLLILLVLGLVLAMASCDMLPESITSILGIGSNDNGQNDGNDAPDDNTSNGENNNAGSPMPW